MEKRYFALPGYVKAFLQIDKTQFEIPMEGNYSYSVCGQIAILYLVDSDFEVVGLLMEGGYINKIKTHLQNEWFYIEVEVFTPEASANPDLVTESFRYQWIDVL